jgi:hypothetical protein
MIDKTTGREQASVRFTQGTTDLVLLDARAAVQRPACLDLGAVLTRALYEVWTRRSHTHVVYTSGPCWAVFVIYALVVFRLSLGYRGSESQHPPRRAAPINLRALPLETSPLARPLARASKECSLASGDIAPLFPKGRDSSAPPCCTTRAAYSYLGAVYVRHGTKYDRAPRKRPNFREFLFYALG